jgi:hypothetical protein
MPEPLTTMTAHDERAAELLDIGWRLQYVLDHAGLKLDKSELHELSTALRALYDLHDRMTTR